MPAFTPYTESEYAPDAPATADHFRRWFQNWEAGFEGAPGAKRLLFGAIEKLAAGDQVRSRDDTERTIEGLLPGHSFSFMQAGTVRVTWDHKAGGAFGVVRLLRWRGGVEVALATWGNSGSYVTRSVDVSVLPGDLVRIENYSGGPTGFVFLRNQRFQTAGGNLWPGSQCRLEGNVV